MRGAPPRAGKAPKNPRPADGGAQPPLTSGGSAMAQTGALFRIAHTSKLNQYELIVEFRRPVIKSRPHFYHTLAKDLLKRLSLPTSREYRCSLAAGKRVFAEKYSRLSRPPPTLAHKFIGGPLIQSRFSPALGTLCAPVPLSICSGLFGFVLRRLACPGSVQLPDSVDDAQT